MPLTHELHCPRRKWHRSFYATCQCALIREIRQESVDAAVSAVGALKWEVKVLGDGFVRQDDAVRVIIEAIG
jgi:hypothetical protein